MIREKQKEKTEIVIDLTGPEGNVFHLIGLASSLAKQMHLDHKRITQEMMSSDYEWAIQVFDYYFGSFVILER